MPDKETKRTLTAGEQAIGYLKYNFTPAIPRYYELWYTYAMGHNQKLITAIKEFLSTSPKLSIEDTERFYENFLSADKLPEKVGEVGAQISTELKEVIDLIDTMSMSSGQYGKSLNTAIDQMDGVSSPEQLKQIVHSLVQATTEMAQNSKELEYKLAESQEQIQELNLALEEIRTESMTDQLTNIANRKRFNEKLAQAMADANIADTPLSLLLADIDFFKKFNDKYGHQTGDQVLCLVAHTLKANVKANGLAARYGGEEFAVLLPKTKIAQALELAEKIRLAVRGKELYQKGSSTSLGRITVSIGAAEYRQGESVEDFIDRTDKCLYAAKDAGRDKVIHQLKEDSNIKESKNVKENSDIKEKSSAA